MHFPIHFGRRAHEYPVTLTASRGLLTAASLSQVDCLLISLMYTCTQPSTRTDACIHIMYDCVTQSDVHHHMHADLIEGGPNFTLLGQASPQCP